MKHAIIVGHPDPTSFTLSVAQTYESTVAALGQTCIIRDLYRIGFDPRLQLAELSTRVGSAPASDVIAERQMLRDVDVFAFVYPLWFFSPPAVIKGYIDRVFGAGFGYRALREEDQQPMLNGRRLISLTSSSSRNAWFNEQGGYRSLCNVFDDYFGRICGLQVCKHIHSASIVPGMDERWISQSLKTVETELQNVFGSSNQIEDEDEDRQTR